jgi:hypothetical protein
MPPLPNAQYELMAQNLAKGMTQTKAYAEAGFKGGRRGASRLSTNPDIRGRVAEIQAETLRKQTEKRVGTLETVHEALGRAEAVAERTGNAKALHDIAVTRAKLFGFGGLLTETSAQVRVNIDVGSMRSADIRASLLERMLKGDLSAQELEAAVNGKALLAGPLIDQ